MKTSNKKTTARPPEKKARKRVGDNKRGRSNPPGGISKDYAIYIDDADPLNLSGEILLVRRFVRELAVLADKAFAAGTIPEDAVGPAVRCDALAEVVKLVGRLSDAVNNFVRTQDRLVRTTTNVTRPTGVISPETYEKYVKTVVEQYYFAIRRNVCDSEVVCKIVGDFLRSMGFNAKELKPILDDAESRYDDRRTLPAPLKKKV